MHYTSHALTTSPEEEPVTVNEADSFLRGNGYIIDEETIVLSDLICSARKYVEDITGKALITQTWTMYLDRWPNTPNSMPWWSGVRQGAIDQWKSAGEVELPRGPLQSIALVQTYSSTNVATTVDPSTYYIDELSDPGKLIFNDGVTLPTFTRTRRGIKISYVCGYGDTRHAVPSPLRMAIKQLVAHWYERRELANPQSDDQIARVPLHVDHLLRSYRKVRL